MAYLLSLRTDVKIINSPLVLVIQSEVKRYSVAAASRELVAAVCALEKPGLSESDLFALLADAPDSEHARFADLLARFKLQGWLCTSVPGSLTLIPKLPEFCPPADPFDPLVHRYRLSRFAYLRRDDDSFLLETPLAPVQIRLEKLSALEILDKESTTDGEAEALKLLYDAHMLEHGVEAESYATWEFHDLLFHARSRRGNHAYPIGATWRFGHEDMPPAFRPEHPGLTIALSRPEHNNDSSDMPFGLVMETRRSIRDYNEKPITLAQLSQFLYRVNRVRHTWEIDNTTYTSRPYPSGGALYELEFYLVVQHCDGLERGLYHYRAQDHSLKFVSAWNSHSEALISHAANATGSPDRREKIQVLIVIAARFARLAWKYEGIAYALILKHVGVLYQTMYLVATAMRLAPCGLGTGDSRAFAAAAGTAYEVESSVGEFLLGSLPDS